MATTPPTVAYADQIFQGTVTFGAAPNFPTGSITAASIAASAGIEYTKLVNSRAFDQELFVEGLSITALASKLVHICRGTSGTWIGLDAVLGSSMTSPSSVSIDLQKSTIGSTVFASVLSTPINLGATSEEFTRYSATFASTGSPMLVGEAWRLVITVAGTTASAAKGLLVTGTYAENPS